MHVVTFTSVPQITSFWPEDCSLATISSATGYIEKYDRTMLMGSYPFYVFNIQLSEECSVYSPLQTANPPAGPSAQTLGQASASPSAPNPPTFYTQLKRENAQELPAHIHLIILFSSVLSLGCTLESSGEVLKILVPRRHPRQMESESLGVGPDILKYF